jgi:hypothetical protein
MNLMVGIQVFKLIQVVIISGIKFLFAPFISIGYGFNYFQTVIFTTLGGIAGLLFFYYLSKWMIRLYFRLCPVVISYFGGEEAKKALQESQCRKPNRKKFTRKNKTIVNIRNKYGLFGIILLTPVLLSIPIGAFLAQKYYSKRNNILVYLSLSVLMWSFFISSFYFLF